MTDTPKTTAEPSWWRRVATRLQVRRVVTRDVLVLAALAGLAVTQPLLDLFGRNPEYFVAQDVSGTGVVVFALVVTFALPLICLVIELVAYAVGDRVGRVVHLVLVALLAATLGLSLAHQVGAGDLLSVVMAVTVGAGITVASARIQTVETVLRYLSGALVLFLVAFLFFSRAGELIGAGEAEALEGVSVDNPAPVVIVQLDEFPLASVLDPGGRINAARYPNFARLAEQSSWFRNATSVSWSTTLSVASALTGKLPASADQLPTSANHPESLFTLLAEDYRMQVDEPVTDLCPTAVCGETEPGGSDVSGARSTLDDASVVFGHLTLPPFLSEDLPAVDRSWGDFIDGGEVEFLEDDQSEPDDGYKWVNVDEQGRAPTRQARALESQITGLEVAAEPTLVFSHVVFPHTPWAVDPSGLEFAPANDQDTPGMENGVWSREEWLVRQGFQRHLLQIGYADTLLGHLIDKMEAAGTWEDALVVVMADHGISFGPGALTREPTDETVHEIYNVPLFIKAPGTTVGQVRDDNALLIDVLPTIVDLLGVDTDWEFDGRSLVGSEPEPDTKPVVTKSGPTEVPVDFEGLSTVVLRNLSRLPHGHDVASIAAVGDLGDLVGQPIEALDVVGLSEVRWTVDQERQLADWRPDEAVAIPLLWTGTVTMPDGAFAPPDILAVVNGRVAGVLGGYGLADNGPDEFTALIAADTLRPGANDISLLVPVDGGRRFEITGGP